MTTSIKLTVFFNEPFWTGVFEACENDGYKACKVTFGAEPNDEEVHEFILKNFYLLNFSNAMDVSGKESAVRKVNPKRLQRKIRKETENQGMGTKAQEALKRQHEENKLAGRKLHAKRKQQKEEEKFQSRQMKRKEKHKGH